MKNVLVISQRFAPENVIAAIRFTKMVKYLARTKKFHFWIIYIGQNEDIMKDELLQNDIEGIEEYVTCLPIYADKKFLKKIKKSFSQKSKNIVTSNKQTESASQKDIYYSIQKNFVSCDQRGIVGAVKRLFGRLCLAVNDVYDLTFEMAFAQKGVKLCKQIPMDDIDVMISTYGQVGSLMLALRLKNIKKGLNWIVDYRDPVRAASFIKKKVLGRIVSKADEKAKFITGVTKSCIGSGKHLEKFYVIPNSYDREDIEGICSVQNEKLTICYTGSLYYNKSDMTPLLKIIHELSEENKLNKKKIRITYAGPHGHSLKNLAKRYELEEILDYRGKIPRKESLQIQKQSDILCALTWNNIGNDEILTGKVLEYFMMQKPIFAIVSGNKPESLLKRIINEAHVGYCLEEAECEKYYEEAKEWFLDRYLEFMESGQITFEPEERILEKYSSEKMAESFGKLIEKC